MNELKVIVNQSFGVINFNDTELKEYVAKKMIEYEGSVFTDDTMDIAKKEVAKLRKYITSLSDERIRIKKEFLVPYTEFEEKVNEISALIEKPIALIDKQIKEYEENKKQEKKAKIVVIYENLIGDIGEYLPFEKIFNNKWLNVSTSIKSITEDIEKVVTSTSQAIQTIKGMNSEVVETALGKYKANLSLTDAITYINQYEAQRIEIEKRNEEKRKADEERRKQAEIDRAKEDERKRVADEERIKEEERLATEQRLLSIKKPVEIIEPLVPETIVEDETDDMEKPFDTCLVESKSITVFKVFCSAEEIVQIEMYMNSIGVEYEKGVSND